MLFQLSDLNHASDLHQQLQRVYRRAILNSYDQFFMKTLFQTNNFFSAYFFYTALFTP